MTTTGSNTRNNDLQMQLPSLIVIFLGLAIVVIAGAWVFEYLGYAPCPLCLQQRYAYYFSIPVSAIALVCVQQSRPQAAQVLLVLCAIAFILNAALGAYHSGVEWEWWAGPTDCTGSGAMESIMSLDAGNLLDQLKETTVVRCDKPAWTFLGLSLAGYNFLISLGLATLALVATRRLSLA